MRDLFTEEVVNHVDNWSSNWVQALYAQANPKIVTTIKDIRRIHDDTGSNPEINRIWGSFRTHKESMTVRLMELGWHKSQKFIYLGGE